MMPDDVKGPEDSPEIARVPITDALDLHPIPPRDIPEVVSEYVWEAVALGLREVRIIHGKGIGFQREVVARVLSQHPAVASYHIAPADRGHWGATIAHLRPGITPRQRS